MKLKYAFEIVGDVAIFETEEKRKDKKIAEEIVKAHKRVKTVLKKISERTGVYRIRKFKLVLGKETETIHKEHGCRYRLDVRKVYFSPREGTERERIAKQVKPGERVLVMFAGIGPYPVIIAKKQPEVERICAVEINPKAVEYMKENIRLNKVSDKVVPVLGDVKEVCKKWEKEFDRVIMPLPKEGYRFLDTAVKCLKPKGILHFYFYDSEKNLFDKAVDLIEKAAKKAGRKAKILSKRKVLPYGPRVWKICIEAEIK